MKTMGKLELVRPTSSTASAREGERERRVPERPLEIGDNGSEGARE